MEYGYALRSVTSRFEREGLPCPLREGIPSWRAHDHAVLLQPFQGSRERLWMHPRDSPQSIEGEGDEPFVLYRPQNLDIPRIINVVAIGKMVLAG